MADSAKQAILRERKVEVADVWVDEGWLNKQEDEPIKGF